MFYRGTEVGCCAIMHEERKRGSKEASSKGNKQRQTGVCLPDSRLNLSRRRTNRHSHTPTNITRSRSKWWPGCSAHLHCVCVCVLESICAKVQTILVMVQNKPASAPAGHKETGGEHGKEVRWMERRGRKERAGVKERTNEGTELYSCWLPSLEASNSLSWGVCQPLVVLSCLLLITVAFCFLHLLFFVFVSRCSVCPHSLKHIGQLQCKLLQCMSEWCVCACASVYHMFLPPIWQSLEWPPTLVSDDTSTERTNFSISISVIGM